MKHTLFWNALGYSSAVIAGLSLLALFFFVAAIFASKQVMYAGFVFTITFGLLSLAVLKHAARKTERPAADFFFDLFLWN